MSARLLRTAWVPLALPARTRPFSTTPRVAEDPEKKPTDAPDAPAAPSTPKPRATRSQAAANEINSLLKGTVSASPAGAKSPLSKPAPGVRVVNVKSLPNRLGRRPLLGRGVLGNVVRNADGTVSVKPVTRDGDRPGGRPRDGPGGNKEGGFRSRSKDGLRKDRPRRDGAGPRGGRDGKPGDRRGRDSESVYDKMTENINWYDPYTKEELEVLAERPPAPPERKSEVFIPKLGVDEILEYAPAVATDSNILGKAGTIRQTLKSIAGGVVDAGHLAHPKMMAAKYDYRGIMYFEKLQTKELLEQRANIKIKLGPDDRLKDVLIRRTIKGQYEPIPPTEKQKITQLTRNYHLKENTWTVAATNKFQAKIDEMLARGRSRVAAAAKR